MTRYGSVLRTAREAAGVTQREIGVVVGKSFGYVSEIELGKRAPFDAADNARIARLLGIPEVRLQVPAAVERREISLRGLTHAGITRVVEVLIAERAGRKGRGATVPGAVGALGESATAGPLSDEASRPTGGP